LIIINYQSLIMLSVNVVFSLEVLIYKRLQMWRHNDVIGRNEYVIFNCQNLPFLGYIHCNFCLNVLVIHRDMKENVSGCFFSEHSVQCQLTGCEGSGIVLTCDRSRCLNFAE